MSDRIRVRERRDRTRAWILKAKPRGCLEGGPKEHSVPLLHQGRQESDAQIAAADESRRHLQLLWRWTYKWKLHAGVVTFCKPWGGEQESFTLSKDGSSMSDGDTYKGALFRLTYIKTNPSHGATGRSHRSARWPILRRKRRGSIPQSERGVMETHVAASRGAAGNLRSSFSARS